MEDPETSAPHRVEAYLDQVLASLPRRLSAFERDELRRELRTHLWERVAAYEELGQLKDDAVTEALTQFGGGQDFLKQWRREWKQPITPVTAREVWKATRLALLLSLLAQGMGAAACVAGSWLAYVSPLSGLFLSTVFYVVFVSGVFLFPIVLGVAHSRRTSHRAGLGMFGALSVEVIGLNALTWLAGRLLPGQEQNATVQNLEGFLIVLSFWLPVATISASLGGWWMQRARARRVA